MTKVKDDFFADKAAVASEYVLGLLDDEERAACRKRLISDKEFRLEVEKLETHFAPLNDEFVEIAAPKRVQNRLNKQLFGTQKTGFWTSLSLWRGLTATCAAVALAAVVLPSFLTQGADVGLGRQLIVSLEAEGSDVKYLALYEAEDGTFKIRSVAGQPAADKSHELWLIEGSDAPKSLGLVETEQLSVSIADFVENDQGTLTFAISLEPLGGSTTGGPTGPVIAVGQALEL